ncbi:MAG TPA: hypothetical protein VEC16_00340 [Alphaproteobacteria bacterium]|nr:hypothetical protein [Alphaproteobacteria bacterium]
MRLEIDGNEISYDSRKDSLLISVLVQNYDNKSKFEKKVNGQLIEFASLIPKMMPEQLLIVEWHSGYSLGHPSDYIGIGAIACKSIKPWKHHLVDHIIHHKKPFSKIQDIKLLNQLSIDYESKIVNIFEQTSNSFGYYVPQKTLDSALKKAGFRTEYSSFKTGNDEISLDEILSNDDLMERIARTGKL